MRNKRTWVPHVPKEVGLVVLFIKYEDFSANCSEPAGTTSVPFFRETWGEERRQYSLTGPLLSIGRSQD